MPPPTVNRQFTVVLLPLSTDPTAVVASTAQLANNKNVPRCLPLAAVIDAVLMR
jgi:hypothetical protein